MRSSLAGFSVLLWSLVSAGLWDGPGVTSQAAEGARQIDFYGYSDCILLSNESTEAVLCPAAGGRILKYALRDRNVLYLPPGDEGWIWDGRSRSGPMNAGRFDIGPEQKIARRDVLWMGKWTGEIIGSRQAKLTSAADPSTGIQLERTFELDAVTSKLTCSQRIINISDETVETCHWSRTFANGRGTCIIPVSLPSRFPQSYVRYDPPGKLINMRPDDPSIRQVDDYLVITDHPVHPKLGFDSYTGWMAYLAPQDLMFVKKFPTYPDRVYNEVAGLTISVWYPDRDMVELEPIGPREKLRPGESASFTETWHLIDYPYPANSDLDPVQIARLVEPLK